MKIIIGLGNPGKEYANTRHNAGFITLDSLRFKWSFPDFSINKKFDAEISEETRNEEKNILVKPQTLMNNSGDSVRKILDFFKLTPSDIVVIHDDLDIELGKFKIATDSGAAGHHGVEDIIEKLGTQQFKRIRIGISKSPEEKASCEISGKDYVLSRFSDEEFVALKNIIEQILEKEV